jgi:hypothetical protein
MNFFTQKNNCEKLAELQFRIDRIADVLTQRDNDLKARLNQPQPEPTPTAAVTSRFWPFHKGGRKSQKKYIRGLRKTVRATKK